MDFEIVVTPTVLTMLIQEMEYSCMTTVTSVPISHRNEQQ